MIEGKSVLAIIPAREGSRRVPLKNIALYRGKTLVEHALDHAKGSKYIDETILLSDSQAILAYAYARPDPSVDVLLEPPHIADHHSTTEAAVAFCLYTIKDRFDFFVILQPTSPLRTCLDIDTCIERALKGTGQCISYNEYGKRNGAVYVSKTVQFLSNLSLSDPVKGSDHFEMPNSRSLDIDYLQDLAT